MNKLAVVSVIACLALLAGLIVLTGPERLVAAFSDVPPVLVVLALALVQIPLALGAMISGIFGMNLYSGYEEERSPVFFWLVAGAIMLMTIIGTAFSFLFMGRSGIMKALDS